MSRKKPLVIALLLVLIATVSYGTLTYFSDSDSVTNTFTIGSIKIELREDFQQKSQLIPVDSNETPTDDPNFVKKVVWVGNTGKNDAYLRVFVAVPAALDNGLLHIHGVNTDKWVRQFAGSTEINGAQYHVYRYTCQELLPTGTETPPLMDGVYIDQAADLEVYRNDAGEITAAHFLWEGQEITSFDLTSRKLDIFIAAQGVQAEGFTDAASALDAAFGNTLPEFY